MRPGTALRTNHGLDIIRRSSFRSWRTCEQAVGPRYPLDEILQPRYYLYLIHDVVESLRPVLLSPESGFQSDLTEDVDALSHIELFHPPLRAIIVCSICFSV